ncbi:MAG: VWA domain-containing protein [Lentisphaerota bacterium]
MNESKFKNVTIQTARPLPVFILADKSGSMAEHGKIEALNNSLRDMIRSLGGQSRLHAEISVAIIPFGGEPCLQSPLKPACQYEDKDIPIFEAVGRTPLGQALNEVRKMIENRECVPSRSYRPTIVLISDGKPTDTGEWEPALDELLKSERVAKTTRLAMGIGPDADEKMLKKFINDLEIPLIHGKDAGDIEKFLRCVTMSVTQRSVQANPNSIVKAEIKELFKEEELDF